MNANQSDDAQRSDASELPSKAELHRVASKLGIYEWERFAYTDAANTAKSYRKAPSGLFTKLKTLLLWLVS